MINDQFINEEKNGGGPSTSFYNIFVNEIGYQKVPSQKEQVELFQRAKRGDEKALDELVRRNQGLVIDCAKRFCGEGIPLLDLIQEGNLTLIKAISSYNPSKQSFATYINTSLRNNFSSYVVDQGSSIRNSHLINKRKKEIDQIKRNFLQEESRVPSDQEIAEEINLNSRQVEEAQRLHTEVKSLDKPTNGEGDTFESIIGSVNYRNPSLMFKGMKFSLLN